MIYQGGVALTDPRRRAGMGGLGFDPVSSLVTGAEQAGEHLLSNVGNTLLHFFGGGDDPAPAPVPKPPPESSMWPWVIGGGVAVAAIGYAVLRKRRR